MPRVCFKIMKKTDLNRYDRLQKGSIFGDLALRFRRARIHRGIQASGMEHRDYIFEGNKFHTYSTYAGRPPLILLHGFLDSSHTFRRIFSDLSDHFDICAVDVPGFGYSTMPAARELWHIDAIARSLARFLGQGLEIKKPILLSHSMGGLISLHMQEYWRHTYGINYFSELHMIAPGVLKFPPEEREEIRSHIFPRSTGEIQSLLKKLYFKNHPDLPGIILSGLLRQWSNISYEFLADNTTEFEDRIFFSTQRLAGLKTKIHMYWGREDELTSIKIGRKMKKVPLVKLHEFEGAGHALHLEDPQRFLEEFLKQSTEPRSAKIRH